MKLTEMLDTVIDDFSMTKTCTVSADADSKTEKKTVHLKIRFRGITFRDILEKAIATVVIQWQTKARKIFASIGNNSTVEIDFSAPSRTTVDAMQVMKARIAAAKTPEEKQAIIDELIGAKQ